MKNYIIKYKSILLYLFFGVCTTLINLVIYSISSFYFKIETVPATVIAWLLAVAFAYFTNRQWVFESKSSGCKEILYECFRFLLSRFLTGILDVLFMYFCVDILGINDILIKTISNMVIILLNYIASKMMVFVQR